MEIGKKVIFKNSVKCVITTPDGYIIEHGPILNCKYEYVGDGVFKNITQPHHLIYWYVDERGFFNGTTVRAFLRDIQE